MRYFRVLLSALLWTSISFPALVHAQQPWSGILSSSRAIDWTHAGLPATLPDGETTPNPWTPPTRTQCVTTACNTVAGGSVTATTINAALASAPQGTYVLIPAGNYTISSANIIFYTQNGVTLRGSGPQSTTLTLTGSTMIQLGGGYGSGSCTWSSGFSAGTTSITVTGCTGPTPVQGLLLQLQQCDSGYSGSGCTTGSSVDNGGLYVCGFNAACQRSGEGTANTPTQTQVVYVTSVANNGGGSYTLGFTPGLYMSNWGTYNGSTTSPVANFTTGANGYAAYGNALEDMTIYATGLTTDYPVDFNLSYASWVKGVRFLGYGAGTGSSLYMNSDKNCLVINNYFFGVVAVDSSYGPDMQEGSDSDDLIMNNIMEANIPWEGIGSMEGDVIAYNYTHDPFTTYVLDMFEHNDANAFLLYEGNQTPSIQEDDTHGTHDLSTLFRNYASGWDAPYVSTNFAGATFDSFNRFVNLVGNTIGGPQLTNYESTWLEHASDYIYSFDEGSSAHEDLLVQPTSMRWGNYDTVTGAIRYCGPGAPGFASAPCDGATASVSVSESGTTVTVNSTLQPALNTSFTISSCTQSGYDGTYSPSSTGGSSFQYRAAGSGLSPGTCTATINVEVPTVLAGNASSFANSVPSTTNLPCSFFLSGYTSPSCTPYPSGGTGLNWWKVCTTWSSFPTGCSTTQAKPFPPIGPDVTGGTYMSGYAYDIPASIAWQKLPVDTTYQHSYSITGSSWSNGTETLTISGLPSGSVHIMGGFQLSGAASACNPSGAELLMTGSSSTTVSYALASNPSASCTGNMLFPDVREFDERVYAADSTGQSAQPAPPTGLTGTVVTIP